MQRFNTIVIHPIANCNSVMEIDNKNFKAIEIQKPCVPYHPELRSVAGSTSAAILMQQLDFRFNACPDGFVKPKTTQGKMVGWLEELNWTKGEFDGALRLICTHYGSATEYFERKKTGDIFQGKMYASFYHRRNKMTYYFQNASLVKKMRKKALGEIDFETYEEDTKKKIRKITPVTPIPTEDKKFLPETQNEKSGFGQSENLNLINIRSNNINNISLEKKEKKEKKENEFFDLENSENKFNGEQECLSLKSEVNDQSSAELTKKSTLPLPVVKEYNSAQEAEERMLRATALVKKGFKKQSNEPRGVRWTREECCLNDVSYEDFFLWYTDSLAAKPYWAKTENRRPNPFEVQRSLNRLALDDNSLVYNLIQEFKTYGLEAVEEKRRAEEAQKRYEQQKRETQVQASKTFDELRKIYGEHLAPHEIALKIAEEQKRKDKLREMERAMQKKKQNRTYMNGVLING